MREGQYTVGTDIKAGKYFAIYAEPGSNLYGKFYVYVDKATFDKEDSEPIKGTYIDGSTRSTVFDLQEGNYLDIYGASFKLCVTDFGDEDYYTLTAPEGTLVPAGTYTVGDEIPAGSYTVYPSDFSLAKVCIYKDAEGLAADPAPAHWGADTIMLVSVEKTRNSTTFKLDEGNIVVTDIAVIMKKLAALSFGD